MHRTNWKIAAVVGVFAAFAGWASADDDIIRLDVRSSSRPILGVGDSESEFTYAERAKADDADQEDVHFRYRRGYIRGSTGGIYILPRFYAFRRGYWDGRSGGGYQAGWYGGNSTPYAGNFGGRQLSAYSNPAQGSVSPANYGSRGNETIPSEPLSKPNRVMSEPEPPLAPPSNEQIQDGGSSDPPRPLPNLHDSSNNRVVKMQPTKKYHYPAYGEARLEERERDRIVMRDKN